MSWWKVPVSWQMQGTVKIQADTLEDALEIAEDKKGIIPIPDNGEYINASWTVDAEDPEYVRTYYNDGQMDKADSLEYAKSVITDFCRFKLEQEPDFSDLEKVGIGYTTITDDEVPVQVNADLVHKTVSTYVGGYLFEREEYGSYIALAEMIESTSFDSLVAVDFDYRMSGKELLKWVEERTRGEDD